MEWFLFIILIISLGVNFSLVYICNDMNKSNERWTREYHELRNTVEKFRDAQLNSNRQMLNFRTMYIEEVGELERKNKELKAFIFANLKELYKKEK